VVQQKRETNVREIPKVRMGIVGNMVGNLIWWWQLHNDNRQTEVLKVSDVP